MAMADKIRHLLIEKKMNIKQLSEILGYEGGNLYGKLHRDNFTEKELRKIAEALDCDYEAYFVIRENGKKI